MTQVWLTSQYDGCLGFEIKLCSISSIRVSSGRHLLRVSKQIQEKLESALIRVKAIRSELNNIWPPFANFLAGHDQFNEVFSCEQAEKAGWSSSSYE